MMVGIKKKDRILRIRKYAIELLREAGEYNLKDLRKRIYDDLGKQYECGESSLGHYLRPDIASGIIAKETVGHEVVYRFVFP